MEENANELDELIIKNGEELDETTTQIVPNNKKFSDNLFNESAAFPTADDVAMSKEEAQEHLIKQRALFKLDEERKEYQKLADEEKIKDYVLKSQYYAETNNFFKKNGYEMSGKQKRLIKRQLERLWNAGKFKLTPEQKEDILYEMNKASNEPLNERATEKKEDAVAANIADLNSLVFKA